MNIKPLTEKQLKFIEDNKDGMKQKDIAAALGVTPACVNKRIKHGFVKNIYFNEMDYAKMALI